jgi:voltage-gated potassium channel Kch
VNIISFLIINIRLLFRNDSYNLFRVIGAINVYLLIALAGAFSFEIIHIIKGNSIQSSMHPLDKALDYSDYIYYSLVSLTTVGYGDLIPMNTATKMLSVFISAIGMLFPAIVIALLISLKRDK